MEHLILSKVDVVLALQGSCIIDVDFSATSSTSSIFPEVLDHDLGSSDRKPEVIGVAAAEPVVGGGAPELVPTPGREPGVAVADACCGMVPPFDVVAGGVGVASAEAMPEEEDPALEVEV